MLQVLQAYHGIENEDLWRVATGVGAGISRQGLVCGALTGGALACGLIIGRQRYPNRDDRTALRDETYAKVQELTRRFQERFGTVECRTMIGCDLSTAEGRQAFQDTHQMELTCRPAVRLVLETVLHLLT